MGKKAIRASFNNKPSKKQVDEMQSLRNTLEMLRLMDQFKMVTFYVLRNQGWGTKRLKAFNAKWNEYFIDISKGLFSIEDVMETIALETGLTPADLMIQKEDGFE